MPVGLLPSPFLVTTPRHGAGRMKTGSTGNSGRGTRRGGGETAGLAERLRRDALEELAGAPLYRPTLIGRVPAGLRLRLAERWPGEAKRGAALAKGEIEFAGELLRNPGPRWFPAGVGEGWLAAWHGFGWLGDLAAAGARDTARGLVQGWVAANAAWHDLAWRSDVLA